MPAPPLSLRRAARSGLGGAAAICFGLGVTITACSAPQGTRSPRADIIPVASSHAPVQRRPLPTTGQIAQLLACTDTTRAAADTTPCSPCRVLNVDDPGGGELRHSRRIPFGEFLLTTNPTEAFLRCVRHDIDKATSARAAQRMLRVELAANRVFAPVGTERADALRAIDLTIDSVLTERDSMLAAQLVGALGEVVWDRATRLLARPLTVRIPASGGGLHGGRTYTAEQQRQLAPRPVERDLHDFGSAARPFRQLPALPTPSAALGDSEADWARQLFDHATSLVSHDEAARTRFTRLALATFVTRDDWSALDSAATAVLQHTPHDSVAPVARALSRFRQVRDPVREFPAAMAMFDSALRAMPRVDSAAYDDFNEVLAFADDQWRREFFMGDRIRLDARSWALLDPNWLTPVNEVHLVRRARMAEADFRYAYLASASQSGSETPLGLMLLKRGVPEARWRATGTGVVLYERRWPGNYGTAHPLSQPLDVYGAAYSDDLTLQRRIHFPTEGRSCPAFGGTTLYLCARADNASWFDVPFEAQPDSIDVTAARFRVGPDSADLYIGARVPLRRFWDRTDSRVHRNDSIVVGATVANALGVQRFQSMTTRPIPGRGDVSTHEQWKVRTPIENMMHRVEAYYARQLQAARGSRMLTSASEATFIVTGFGLSDILVADEMAPAGGTVQGWRDLRTVPNGGVIPPGGAVSLAWEIYDLAPAPDGRVRWRVTIKREDGRSVVTTDVRQLLIGLPDAGAKVMPNQPDASRIVYERTEKARPVVVDLLRFRMTDVAAGRHVLLLQVEDLVSGRSATRSASIRILAPSAQQRR